MKDEAARWAILVYGNETFEAQLSAQGWESVFTKHSAFAKKHSSAIIEAERFGWSRDGIAIRGVDGEIVATDGPVVDTDLQLRGIYILEAPNIDTIKTIARDLPYVGPVAVEVRPIVGHERSNVVTPDASRSIHKW